MNPKTAQKIIIGLSGGVDSSVAAYCLLKQGYHVEAMFMKNWAKDDTDQHCPAEQDHYDARLVSARLGIKLTAVDFHREYWDRVFCHFLSEYQAHRTPNPDVLCNKEIKFRAFLDHAKRCGAEKIATGHYARLKQHPNGMVSLHKGIDAGKDQSYFLHALNQEQLSQSLFPIGSLHKEEVRLLAKELDLVTHDKKDSTGICFIGERPFKNFLKEYVLAQPGPIQTTDGTTLGMHDGLMFYTLGQRQGLGLGGIQGFDEAPWFVLDKETKNNILIVGQGINHPRLLKRHALARQTHWIDGQGPTLPHRCTVKTRYRQADQPCTLKPFADDLLEVIFDEPQRAVTPGQYMVFYSDDQCLGGGVIETEIPKA